MKQYYTYSEIKEIPVLIKQLLKGQFDWSEVLKLLKASQNIFFIGSGSAAHAALFGYYLFNQVIKKRVYWSWASEFDHLLNQVTKGSVIIAVSQSGASVDILKAIRTAKKKGAQIIALTNNSLSPLAKISDYLIDIKVGEERSILATKSYVFQLIYLVILNWQYQNKTEKYIKNQLSLLFKNIRPFISLNYQKQVIKIGRQLKEQEDIYILGGGLNYPTALEAALKFKEGNQIHAESFAPGEIKHGILTLVKEKQWWLAIFDNDQKNQEIKKTIKQFKEKGGRIIGLSSKKNRYFDFWLKVPALTLICSPIINIIPLQLLVYYLARLRGLNPDQPPYLEKIVKK